MKDTPVEERQDDLAKSETAYETDESVQKKSATDEDIPTIENSATELIVRTEDTLSNLNVQFWGWECYAREIENTKNSKSELATPPESHYHYSNKLGVYTPKEMDRLSALVASKVSKCTSFDELRISLGNDLTPTTLSTLAKTLRRASNDKELLEQKYQLDHHAELERGEDKYLVQHLDSFFARTIAAGHQLTVNLVLAELYYLANSLDKNISADCRDACKECMEKAIEYMGADIRVDRSMQRFVDGKGNPVQSNKNHTFSQHYRRELKISIQTECLTLFTRDEVKLLAIFRAFADETKQIKDDIAVLLATAYAAEEGAFLADADMAISRYVGLPAKDLMTNNCRLTASKTLTPGIEEAIQALQPGYEYLREVLGANPSVTLDRIIPTMERSFMDNVNQVYMGFNNTKLGNATKIVAFLNGVVALGGLSIVRALGLQESTEALPFVGSMFSVMMNPLYTFSTFISLAVLLDKTPDWMRNINAYRLLGRIKENIKEQPKT